MWRIDALEGHPSRLTSTLEGEEVEKSHERVSPLAGITGATSEEVGGSKSELLLLSP